MNRRRRVRSLLSALFLWRNRHFFVCPPRCGQSPLRRQFFAGLRQPEHLLGIARAAEELVRRGLGVAEWLGRIQSAELVAGKGMNIQYAFLAAGLGGRIQRAGLAAGLCTRIRGAGLAAGLCTRIRGAGFAAEKGIDIRRAEPILRTGRSMDIVAHYPKCFVVVPSISCVCAFL